MWNYCNTVKIKILFEGKIAEFNCYYKNTIKQIIQQYINSFLNPSYNLNSFSLTINNKICLLESTLETYINDISINNIFFLSYNYNKVNNNNTYIFMVLTLCHIIIIIAIILSIIIIHLIIMIK